MAPFARRRARLLEAIDREGAAVFLSSRMADIRYFTGCMDAGGWLVLDSGGAWLLTNAHDGPQAIAEAVDADISVFAPADDPIEILSKRLIGVAAAVTPEVSLGLAQAGLGPELRLRPEIASDLRRIKEPGELELIRQAARIVEAGMAAAKAALRPGVREIEAAAEAEYAMRKLGADGRVFETKIESGPKAAMPSTYAGERVIEAGDMVLIDMGPTYRGYFGDLTRTFIVSEPRPERLALIELALAAQANALAAAKAGVAGAEVDAAARNTIDAGGRQGKFLHATGHTLGLAADAVQILSPRSRLDLRAGECVTVEPGVYVEGIGGVRIEDEILITATGFEYLTSFPKTIDSLVIA